MSKSRLTSQHSTEMLPVPNACHGAGPSSVKSSPTPAQPVPERPHRHPGVDVHGEAERRIEHEQRVEPQPALHPAAGDHRLQLHLAAEHHRVRGDREVGVDAQPPRTARRQVEREPPQRRHPGRAGIARVEPAGRQHENRLVAAAHQQVDLAADTQPDDPRPGQRGQQLHDRHARVDPAEDAGLQPHQRHHRVGHRDQQPPDQHRSGRCGQLEHQRRGQRNHAVQPADLQHRPDQEPPAGDRETPSRARR